MSGFVETLASWPFCASVAAAITVRGLLAGRRRAALNEALHELRRPLQALVLATEPGVSTGDVESSLRLATVALERLDREVNGRPLGAMPATVRMRPLIESAVARWRARASLAGGGMVLRWRAGDATVEGDGVELSQAVDNLLVNAIEHGGTSVVVEARQRESRLSVSVADSGCVSSPAPRRKSAVDLLARIGGKRRRGHGLAVVRRTAVDHGGHFALHRSGRGALAVLELPLADAHVPLA